MPRANHVCTDRNALLQNLAEHYEQRARTLDEMYRRFHCGMVTREGESLKAQALAFREAAAYAHQQKEGS